MRLDSDIQADVSQELNWEPRLYGQDITVGIRDGVVTLAGFVDTYPDKVIAERMASCVKGVKQVASNIRVRLPLKSHRTDAEIARAAVYALTWHSATPEDRVKVKVDRGCVRLEGEVDWYYQKDAAEKAVRILTGVTGVENAISLKARPTPADVTHKIAAALHRTATFDAEHVTVDVQNNEVILRGIVRSFAEKREIERAVAKAPGVTRVRSMMTVDPFITCCWHEGNALVAGLSRGSRSSTKVESPAG